MKSMSDKELDDFFKSSLEGFEQKPVAGCWNKIEQQLGNQPVKKTVLPYWLAAASVVMVIGLSVKLYNSEEQTIKLTRAVDAPLFTEMADNPVQVISVDEENITEDFDLEKS